MEFRFRPKTGLAAETSRRLERGLEKILSHAPASVETAVHSALDEVRALIRHPRTASTWLGAHNSWVGPWLGRGLLGAASNWAEPFTLGMGLHVTGLAEDLIEVKMSGGWRNQGDGGAVHSGALATLGEFAARLFWEQHLDLQSSFVESKRIQVRILSRPSGEMKAVFRLPVADREAIQHRLRAEQSAQTETQTPIYDHDGRLVAEVDVDWQFTRRLVLGPGIQKTAKEDHDNERT